MAVYQFSALSDGQAISFSPNADQLNFDQAAISAADVRTTAEGTSIRVSASGKEVLLLDSQLAQLTTINVTFADGSRLIFGDNTTAQTADNSANSLAGTGGNDHLWGFGGNDTLSGGSGNDWLAGGTGQDSVIGGAGADSFVYREAPSNSNFDRIADFVSGTDRLMFHRDVFSGVDAPGAFRAGAGLTGGQDADDRIVYNTSTGFLYYDPDGSGAARAQLIGTLNGAPAVAAGDIAAFDDATVASGPEPIAGTEGDDSLVGTAGDDLIIGGGGRDTLDGGPGADTMEGGRDDDLYIVDNPGDVAVELNGGGGNDEVHSSVGYALSAWVNNIVLTGSANIDATGNELPNVLTGNSGNNRLLGGAGDDVFLLGAVADPGDDFADGGEGIDTVDYRDARSAVWADLDETGIRGGGEGGTGDLFVWNIENFLSGAFDDRLIGNRAANRLDAGAGNDTVQGAWGKDTVAGGQGADLFFYSEHGPQHSDVIEDFTTGMDTVQFLATTFLGLGSEAFVAGDARFWAAPGANAAHDESDRLVYDTTSGALYYDADGVDGGAARLVAMFQGAPTLSATDLSVHRTEGPAPIRGTAADDTIFGSADSDWIEGLDGNDSIVGQSGDDTLIGGSGHDALEGGPGWDRISGGPGSDLVLFRSPNHGVDELADLVPDLDVLGFHNDGFTEIGPAGAFTAGDDRFLAAPGATGGQDAEDRVIYDTVSGNLYYDADGSGPGAAVLLATLRDAPPISARDIAVFGVAGVTLAGSDGGDYLVGTRFGDTLLGRGGSDWLFGQAGDDFVDGGDGMDAIDASVGNDTLLGGAGQDNFYFTYYTSTYGMDVVDGGPDHDSLAFDGPYAASAIVVDLAAGTVAGGGPGGAGSAQVASVEGVLGTQFADRIVGNASDNYFIGWNGDDTLEGGAGRDNLEGAQGADLIIGGDGNDVLKADGRSGSPADGAADTLIGGLGNDQFYVSSEDVISDSGGIDDVIAQESWTLGADFENLFLQDGDIGGRGNASPNLISAFAGDNLLEGLGGNDTLVGAEGDDTLDGGEGNDVLAGGLDADVYAFSVAPGIANADQVNAFHSAWDDLHLDAAAHAGIGAPGRFAEGDERFWAAPGGGTHDATDRVIYNTLSGQLWYDADGNGAGAAQLIATLQGAPFLVAGDIVVTGDPASEPIVGTGGDDSLAGGAGNDTLRGLAGRDTLNGGAGDDWLEGGTGIDSLTGGAGEDSFVFRETPANSNFDRLLDFTSGTDTLRFDDAAYGNIGALGDFAAGDDRFFAGAGAKSGVDAEDRLIYNTSTGVLWYDADGSGPGGQMFVATLQGAPALSAGDIAVI